MARVENWRDRASAWHRRRTFADSAREQRALIHIVVNAPALARVMHPCKEPGPLARRRTACRRSRVRRHAFYVTVLCAKTVAEALPKNTKLSVARTPKSGME